MDTTLKHLGMAVLFAMQRTKPAPKLFLDYMGQTILAHAAHAYGRTPLSPGLTRGHPAPWQARRAKEFLNANLYSDVSLSSVAAECNLSVSHFAHAFRRTFGRPPHRWLMERRIDAVKNLLLTHAEPSPKWQASVALPTSPPSTDLSSASRERVRANGARAEKAINKQFPPRPAVLIFPTIRTAYQICGQIRDASIP
jgi:AraC-like DNA-binding protein